MIMSRRKRSVCARLRELFHGDGGAVTMEYVLLCTLIAAASILAKTARDAYCLGMEERYPGYGFAQHKGYPTAAHVAALHALGPCPEHRRSFGPVSQLTLF